MEIDGVFPVLTAVKYAKKLKLKNFIRKYAGTEQVAEAQALLDKL